jgi:serine/threonine protein kinase
MCARRVARGTGGDSKRGFFLYELLSGKKPHDGDSFLAILHRVTTQPPVDLRLVAPDLPDGVYAVVAKAMAPDPASRFSTAAELGDALIPFTGRPLAPIRTRGTPPVVKPSSLSDTQETASTVSPGSRRHRATPTPCAGVGPQGERLHGGGIEHEPLGRPGTASRGARGGTPSPPEVGSRARRERRRGRCGLDRPKAAANF